MSRATDRQRVLGSQAAARPRSHRYTVWRWAAALVCTLLVALLPLTGLLRFDLWGGRHLVGGEEHDLVSAARAFAFPFLAINVVILLVTRFLGRYLCGFGCPVGALARAGDWLRYRTGRATGTRAARLGLAAACLLLSAVCFSFWVDWRVFAAGSPAARGVAAAALLGVAAALYLGALRLGLRFCRDYCPSGVYFGLLGHDSRAGVELAHPEACIGCDACDKACPMDLPPRELLDGAATVPGRGIYPDGLTRLATCIRCGDCVQVCEGVTRRLGEETPLQLGLLPAAHDAGRDEQPDGAAAPVPTPLPHRGPGGDGRA